MKISIVTISFNQKQYLRQAIESVLNQGYSDLEYILVDPGSTDGSRELIQSYSRFPIRTIFETDSGPADGLNRGFSRASGELFGFLNADDVLLPGALKCVAAFFENSPDCNLVFGNGFVIDEEGSRQRHIIARDFTMDRYFHGGSRFLQQSTFFRRAAFEQIGGFNAANRTSWDGELFVRMVGHGTKVGYIDADLAEFRIHANSISGSGRSYDAYKMDSERLFREFYGRKWGLGDKLQQVAYRAEAVLIHLGSYLSENSRKVNQ